MSDSICVEKLLTTKDVGSQIRRGMGFVVATCDNHPVLCRPIHTAPPKGVHQWWVEQKEKWGKQHRENRMKNTTYEMQADGALTILDDFKMELIKAIGYDISTHTIIERENDE